MSNELGNLDSKPKRASDVKPQASAAKGIANSKRIMEKQSAARMRSLEERVAQIGRPKRAFYEDDE